MSEIKTLFPIKRKPEREYLKKLASDIESYCRDASLTTKQELYDNFGTPYEVMSSYFSAMDTDYIVKRLKLTKFIRSAVIIFLALATIATTAFCIFLHRKNQLINEAYSVLERQEVVVAEEEIVVEDVIGEEFINKDKNQ